MQHQRLPAQPRPHHEGVDGRSPPHAARLTGRGTGPAEPEVPACAWRDHANAISFIRLGAWWKISLLVITPVLLGGMTLYDLYTEVTSRYGDYPLSGLLAVGWGAVALSLVAALVLSQLRKGHEMKIEG